MPTEKWRLLTLLYDLFTFILLVVIRVVSDLLYLSPLDNVVTWSFYLQGFNDVTLTPGEAAMVIHNYEVRTGHVVSMAELEGGYLKGQLKLEDYDLKQQVSLPFIAVLSDETTPEGPLREGSLMLLPREGSRSHIS